MLLLLPKCHVVFMVYSLHMRDVSRYNQRACTSSVSGDYLFLIDPVDVCCFGPLR